MAKMIPDFIDQEDSRRNGERMVFEWLSDKTVPGTVYYSLLQKNHKHKLIGEVDFLYVSERGFLCIEVKGGQDIYRNDMEWFSVNRRGEHNSIHDPFRQAKDCQYALKEYFTSVYGKYSPQSKYLIGYAVIFPECKFTGKGNDLVTEVMFDGRYDLSDFPKYLERVFDYWEQLEISRHNYTPARLTQSQLQQANDLLRGDFHVVPSMHLELQHVEQQMINLTEEQYDVLDIINENSRVIVQGAAGTGKTLLALELARRHAAKEKRTLYLCYNNNMADYAEMSLQKCPNIEVYTFHSLIMNILNDRSLYMLSLEELSNKFIRYLKMVKMKYSAIVIDEGQDLFTTGVMDVLNELLEGGLEYGHWVVFLDPNQNIFNPSDEYKQTLEFIRELYHPTVLPLKTNCRNTQPIASRTAALTITSPAKNLKLAGPKVITRSYSDKRDFLSSFTRELQSLLVYGVSAADIVVLSKYRKTNSYLADVKSLCNLEVVEQSTIKEFSNRCLNYYTAQSFKGLESKVVFYIDIDGFASVQDRMTNYVAMSRAKFRLYLFYNEDKKQEYQDTLDTGTDLLA